VERCRESGHDAAFAELVRRYRGPVFRLAVSILGQEFAPEAESVAQDSYDQSQDERRQRAVLACVGELPAVYQSALRLHYWLDASVSEIAVMLDAPENTVKSYLHRARRPPHAMLEERGFDAR